MRLACIAFAASLALAGNASAEINMADSIEWVTADSEVVVRGFAESTAKVGDGWDVTFQIVETVKSGVKGVIHVGVGSWLKPDEWVAKKTDLLLFLVPPSRDPDHKSFAALPYVLRPTHGSGTPAVPLGTTQVYLADFGTAITPTDVLAAVRASSRSRATTSQRIDVPLGSAAGKALYGGSSVWMQVPVDAQLEKRANVWMTDSNAQIRVQGVQAIGHFRSADNIARVTKLLADPGTWTETGDAGKFRVYPVRKAADEALTAWGISHARPTTREPLP